MLQRICRKEEISPLPTAGLGSRLKVSLTEQKKLMHSVVMWHPPQPRPRLQKRFSLVQLSNAAQCWCSLHLCKREIMALMSHFLRNITALQDLYSPVRQQGGPQIPRLPSLSLALYHHHSSASSETSVSFIINGCHMKRWGKTPQESQHENWLEELCVETEW